MKEPKTQVVFRKWRKKYGSGIIALFPNEIATYSPAHCQSYESIGQHGAADPHVVISKTVPAMTGEAQALKNELTRIGYNLHSLPRIPRQAMQTRREKIAKLDA